MKLAVMLASGKLVIDRWNPAAATTAAATLVATDGAM